MAGNKVKLTPKGLLVMVRQRRISLRKCSGVGWVKAVKIPRPPALETAEASSAVPTCKYQLNAIRSALVCAVFLLACLCMFVLGCSVYVCVGMPGSGSAWIPSRYSIQERMCCWSQLNKNNYPARRSVEWTTTPRVVF